MEARGVKGVLCPRGRVRQWKEGWRSPYRQQWVRKEGGEAKGYYGALLLALFVDASVERFEMRPLLSPLLINIPRSSSIILHYHHHNFFNKYSNNNFFSYNKYFINIL